MHHNTIPDPRSRYRIDRLLRQFDERCPRTSCDCRALSGGLASLFGEEILIDVLADAVRRDDALVRRLPGRPHRDDMAFAPEGATAAEARQAAKGGQRDLDAWLLVNELVLAAVEAKMLTASSYDCRKGYGPDITAYARTEYDRFAQHNFTSEEWDTFNKIALPLKQPREIPSWRSEDPPDIGPRYLAIWRPVSADGHWFSDIDTTTQGGAPMTITVFSASLYLRHLQDEKVATIPVSAEAQRRFDAAQYLIEPAA